MNTHTCTHMSSELAINISGKSTLGGANEFIIFFHGIDTTGSFARVRWSHRAHHQLGQCISKSASGHPGALQNFVLFTYTMLFSSKHE